MNKLGYPTITIVTICYNAASTIERTLTSVSEQTYRHIEYLVVDGASTDETLSLVRHLAPQALVHSERDRGIYDAMNKGLARATGDYIWYLNAGDALPSPTTVEQVADVIASSPTPVDVVYGDCLLIDEAGQVLAPRRLRPPRRLDWRSFIWGMTVCHQSFVARRAICPPYDLRYRFSSDVDWCIRVLKGASLTIGISEPLSLYLHEGTTTRNHRRSLRERFDVMRRHYGLLPTLGVHIAFAFRLMAHRLGCSTRNNRH